MARIKIHDKWFETSIPHSDIVAEVKRVAAEINRDYAGKRPILLVC